jgi:hypothetical protein
MCDVPKAQLPLTRCVCGYQDEPGAPVILPTACRLHCPIVRDKKVREVWLNAQDCADRLGYRSTSTFTGARRRGRIFRNMLRRVGTYHRANGFPLCGLLAYKELRIATAGGVGPVPPFAQAKLKAERQRKEAKREAESRAKQQALVRALEAFERMPKPETRRKHGSTRRIVVYFLRHRGRLSDGDIARVVGITKQRVWAIKHGVNR